jgi:hypothetical protein
VLLQSLATREVDVDASTISRLNQVAAGDLTGGSAEALLGEVFRLMSSTATVATLTDSQREIASRLNSADENPDFVKWQAGQAGVLETRSRELEKRLAELSVYLDDVEVKQFSDRLSTIDGTEDESSRNLRLDSLVLDLSTRVSQARQHAALAKQGREVLARLDAVRGKAALSLATLRTTLADALTIGETLKLRPLVDAGNAALAAATAKHAADARRVAVLAGLQALGYDVREGMSTAWEQKGRVILRKPRQADYGVEISSAANGERMQVRAVAFSASRDLSRDSNVETSWCGDFGKLQTMLSSQGGTINIERSNAAGALPLKAVAMAEPVSEAASAPLVREL